MDDTEESVRKTLMVQHSRFVDSGNRQSSTFSMEVSRRAASNYPRSRKSPFANRASLYLQVNYLGDRLQAELALLGGVTEEPEGLPAERFPHTRAQLVAMRASLPRAFDWRERGAVTHVRCKCRL